MCKKVQFTTATEPPLTDVFQKISLKISDSALRDASDLQASPNKAPHRSILARCGLTGSVRAAALIGARILAWTWARIAAHFSNRATEPIATTVYFILKTRTFLKTYWKTSLENYEEALQDCKKAISFEPDYSKAYSRMGLIYSKINLYAESENCYEKALKLEPDNESYKKNLEVKP